MCMLSVRPDADCCAHCCSEPHTHPGVDHRSQPDPDVAGVNGQSAAAHRCQRQLDLRQWPVHPLVRTINLPVVTACIGLPCGTGYSDFRVCTACSWCNRPADRRRVAEYSEPTVVSGRTFQTSLFMADYRTFPIGRLIQRFTNQSLQFGDVVTFNATVLSNSGDFVTSSVTLPSVRSGGLLGLKVSPAQVSNSRVFDVRLLLSPSFSRYPPFPIHMFLSTVSNLRDNG